MLLLTVIKIGHELVLFSEFNAPKIYFELAIEYFEKSNFEFSRFYCICLLSIDN